MKQCHKLALTACLAVFLAGCGAGDRTILLDPPGTPLGSLDEQLLQALDDAGVAPVDRPQAEPQALLTLGQALFFDKELSGNRNISCATCHHSATWTGDQLSVSLGEGGTGLGSNREQGAGAMIPRNAPHVFNGGVSGVNTMFWDSRVKHDPLTGELDTPEPGLNGATPALAEAGPLSSALAAQAMFPVTSREEMRGQIGAPDALRDATTNTDVWDALMDRLGAFPQYRALFEAAFPLAGGFDNMNFGHAARAMAAFEREQWTALDSPFDGYVGGDVSALSDAAKRGGLLFYGRALCSVCHAGPLMTDFEHHAVCIPQVGPGKVEISEDRGLALETGDTADDYKFRTPSLRNVALTGPWMHDGAFTSLETAVRHQLDPVGSLTSYDASQLQARFTATVDTDVTRNAARAAALDPVMSVPVILSDAELGDLMAFLHALTDPASLNLLQEVPDSVPSGLPVRD